MSLKSNFGKRIKKLREALMLSQEALAEKIGIHRNTLARIESGKNFVSYETLEVIPKVLGVEYDELFQFDKPVKKDMSKAFFLRLNELSEADAEFFVTSIDAYLKAKNNK